MTDASVILLDYRDAVTNMAAAGFNTLPDLHSWLTTILNAETRELKYRLTDRETKNLLSWEVHYRDVKDIDDFDAADEFLLSRGYATAPHSASQSLKSSSCGCGHDTQSELKETLKCASCNACKLKKMREEEERLKASSCDACGHGKKQEFKSVFKYAQCNACKLEKIMEEQGRLPPREREY